MLLFKPGIRTSQHICLAGIHTDSAQQSEPILHFIGVQDAASILGHSLDGELEALLPLLVKKAGSASLGRDNFLAMHADKVLVVFMTSVSPLRFTGAILTMSIQKGPKLRCKVASLLAACLDSHIGPRLVGEPLPPYLLCCVLNQILLCRCPRAV